MKYCYPAFIPAVIDRLITKIKIAWSKLKSIILCWSWGVKSGKNVVFFGPTILRSHGGDIVIGDNTKFNSIPELNTVGLQNPTILDTRYGGGIIIGNDCGFSSVVMTSKTRITVGSRVLMGGNVRVFDHDFHSTDWRLRGGSEDGDNTRTKAIEIGDDVFIGTNSIILKGTRLGARTMVSAGSVVFGINVPPDSLVKGNPAEVIPQRVGDNLGY